MDAVKILLSIMLDQPALQKVNRGLVSVEDALEGIDKEAVKLAEAFENKVVSALKEVEEQSQQTRKELNELKQTGAQLGQIGQTLAVGGTAIVAGIFAAANREAQRIKEAGGVVDETTQRWLDANAKIEKSTQRIGKVAESAVLPTLEKAADVAEKIAKFVEDNPEVVRAAFKVGAAVATVGTLVSLLGKGLRLYADAALLASNAQQFLAAATIKKSSTEMLAAALAMQKATGGSALSVLKNLAGSQAGGGLLGGGAAAGLAKALGSALVLVLAPIIGGIIGKGLGNAIGKANDPNFKEQSFKDVGQSAAKLTTVSITGYVSALEKLGVVQQGTTKKTFDYMKALFGIDKASEDAKASVSSLADEVEGLKILRDLGLENIAARNQYITDRAKVIQEASNAISDSSNRLGMSLRSISRNLRSTISNIKSSLESNLSSMETGFNEANRQAAQQLQDSLASIAQQGADQIREIEKQKQEDLQRLEEEHNQRVFDLTAARDALGLQLENEAYEKQKSEVENQANEQAAEVKRQTERQIKEARAAYERERQERARAYRLQIEEAKKQAEEQIKQARQQAADQRAAAIEQHNAEVADIKRRKAQELAELAKAYNEERRLRVQKAYNDLKDLGNAANSERLLKQKYYSIILDDAKVFMNEFQKTLDLSKSSGSTVGSRATGGYVNAGKYQMHDKEWVADRGTTAALESMVGGRLTQTNVRNISRSGGSQVTWNDHRSFSGEYTPAMKKQIEQDTMTLLEEITRKDE